MGSLESITNCLLSPLQRETSGWKTYVGGQKPAQRASDYTQRTYSLFRTFTLTSNDVQEENNCYPVLLCMYLSPKAVDHKCHNDLPLGPYYKGSNFRTQGTSVKVSIS